MINLVKLTEETAFVSQPFDEETCLRIAVMDTETTGLDYQTDEVIELAIVVVVLNERLEFCAIERRYNQLQQPITPITPELTAIHGITNEEVEGKRFDLILAKELLDKCHYILCHNSKFDRNFIDKIIPTMAKKQYLCSLTQIDWDKRKRLIPTKNLISLAVSHGFYFEAHRAIIDTLAVVELMNRANTYAEVIESANQDVVEVQWVLSFHDKDHAKANKFNWNPDSKAWTRIMSKDDFNETASKVTVGEWRILRAIDKLDTFKDM